MRVRAISLTTLVIFTVAWGVWPSSAHPVQTPSTPMGQSIFDFLNAQNRLGCYSGTAMLSIGGSPDLALALGFSNQENSLGHTFDTSFKIGSVSRLLTASLVLSLVQEGRLSLETPLQTILSEFTRKGTDLVTIHDLLAQTSGLPEHMSTWKTAWRMRNYGEKSPKGGLASLVNELASEDLDFPPGSRGETSHANFLVLSRIVEKVSGEAFASSIRRFATGLGLKRTGYDISKEFSNSSKAIGYEYRAWFDPRGWFSVQSRTPVAWRHPDWEAGSAGLFSSANDLSVFSRALFEDRVLSRELREKMLQPQIRRGPGAYMGYGIEVQDTSSGRIYHVAGGSRGSLAFWAHHREKGATLVVLSNFALPAHQRAKFFKELLQRLSDE